MRVEVCDSLEAVGDTVWDNLAVSRSVFQSIAWYRMAPALGKLRLLIAYDQNRPIALLPLYIVQSADHYYHSPRDLLCGFRERELLRAGAHELDSVERAAAGEWFPAAVSVSPYGYRGGLLADRADDVRAAAGPLIRAADELCRREGVRVAAFYYLNDQDDRNWISALANHGADIVVAGADCNLTVEWGSLSEYFGSLGERGRRLRAAHSRILSAPEISWRSLSYDGVDHADGEHHSRVCEQAADLFSQSARRHGETEPPASLYRGVLCRWRGFRLLLTGETGCSNLRSALLVLRKGTILYPKFFGAAPDTKGDYLFMTYSCLIDYAISAGITRIEYGGGSHKAKALRGARLRFLFAALKIYDQGLARRLAPYLLLYNETKIRHFSDIASRYHVDHIIPSAFEPWIRRKY